MMIKKLLTIATAVAASTCAFAADLPSKKGAAVPAIVAAPFSWNGFYIGVVGAYSFGKTKNSISGVTLTEFDVDGVMAGGTAGYNVQSGNWIVGLEADIVGGNANGSGAALDPTSNYPSIPSATVNWLSTVRARAGLSMDRFFVYGTAGYAFGSIKGSLTNVTEIGDSDNRTATQTRTGWAVGAGTEYALSQNISAKLEYMYVDLGEKSVFMPGPLGSDLTFDSKFKTQSIRAGLNYRF